LINSLIQHTHTSILKSQFSKVEEGMSHLSLGQTDNTFPPQE